MSVWVGWKRLLALAISKLTFIKVCQNNKHGVISGWKIKLS